MHGCETSNVSSRVESSGIWAYLMLSVNILCSKQPLSSARIKSSNIVFIRHKLSLSCSICDFIKHKCSFKAIIILALNSPLSTSMTLMYKTAAVYSLVNGDITHYITSCSSDARQLWNKINEVTKPPTASQFTYIASELAMHFVGIRSTRSAPTLHQRPRHVL